MSKFSYPEARRDETAVDVYHGVEVKDPYRWLENPNSEETKKFISAQNAVSLPFIQGCSERQAIRNEITKFWNYPKYSCPENRGDKYYFFMNTGLQNQDVLYIQDSLGGQLDSQPRIFLDPNALSDDNTVQLKRGVFSEDGNIYAYKLSTNGSDWTSIHFMDVKNGKKYPETLEKVKFSQISWTHDNKGIFYSCYPDQIEKSDGSEIVTNKNNKIYYHRVGSLQSEDILIADFPEQPLWEISATVTTCGKWLIVNCYPGFHNNLVFFSKLNSENGIKEKLELTEIVGTLDADYEYIANYGTKAIFKTNKNASNYKLMSIDLEHFEKNQWIDLVLEHPANILESARAVDKDKLIIQYLENVKNVLGVYSMETGHLLRRLPVEAGTINECTGNIKSSKIFYKFTSFLTPGMIYTVDLTNEDPPKIFRESKISEFDPNLYKVEQIFYSSKDGTKVPMFTVTKKNFIFDSSSPCLLYGYGGFNLKVQPSFTASRIVFLKNLNGVLAFPNIRGGGEYGKKWHNGGRLDNKQNVFDDFQCAAEYLIKNQYTTAKKIIIKGESNGGLLVAACMNQRPELFGAAIAGVGLMDMLKYHKFTVGHTWITEYGSSDDPKQFNTLLKYSPLHNVKAPKNNEQYPAVLLVTADHDDRVVPSHSLKLIATLQHEIGRLPQQTNPLLINIEVNSGHGLGSTSKQIEEETTIMSFYVRVLNLIFQ